jgi:hypothetical protein
MLGGNVFRVTLVSCALVPLLASAATVPLGGSPLAVHLGDRSQLQAVDSGSTTGIFYPPSGTTGDAGFFLAFPTGAPAPLVGKVYGFSGAAGPSLTTLYTPLTQGTVSGSGSAADPLTQVTTYSVRPSVTDLVRVTQTTRYVNGSHEFSVRWDVQNLSGAPLVFKALVASDFFFNGSDRGTGIYIAGPPRFIGGTNVESGNSGGFVEDLTTSPPWSAYQALPYGGGSNAVWGKIASAAATTTATFDDTVLSQAVDNAGGVEWDQNVAAPLANGATAVFVLTVRSAVPTALQIEPTTATGPRGTPIVFTVTAADTAGTPYAGRTLRYAITGANSSSGAVVIGVDGGATITDPGTNIGDDMLVVYLDFNDDETRQAGEPQGSALATFVDDGAPACSVDVSGDRPGGRGFGKPLTITVNCDERSTVAASTTLEPVRALRVSPRGAIAPQARTSAKRRRKIIDLGTLSALAAPGEAVPIDVFIPPGVARKYAGKTLKATITVVATDDAGNAATTTVERVVRLAKVRKH